MEYELTSGNIRAHLAHLEQKDAHLKKAIELVGYPDERRNPHGFDVFLRIISGQQLSVKAAATIYERFAGLMDHDPTPEKLLRLTDEEMRGAGMSKQKVIYVRSLAEAVLDGPLDLAALPSMSDEDALAAITAVKGLGRWSAEMYLIFSLGRPDMWPVDDLAVRKGIARILELDEEPKPKALDEIGERWRPYRSAVALLSWHYYSNAPF